MKVELEPLPFEEAIAFFRSKGYAPQLQRFDYRDHWREEHARAFVVAKAMDDDVLEAIRGELDRALAEGRTLKQFQADLAPRLAEMGWWGRAERIDPLTGETRDVQLGSMSRLRTIFDTNMRTSHAAGEWAKIQRLKRAFPYLEYVQIQRDSKRDAHARYHGLIRPVDDPIWQVIFPPNGYFCGCRVRQLTEGQLRREGKQVSDPIDLETIPYTNPRTGETGDVPLGVTPGFDTNPGREWLEHAADWDAVAPDLGAEARARLRGYATGLRVLQLGDPREAGVAFDPETGLEVKSLRARSDDPDKIVYAGEPGVGVMHSHPRETQLSYVDLIALSDQRWSAVSAVTPEGSVFRAVLRQPAVVERQRASFMLEMTERGYFDDLRPLPIDDARVIYEHLFASWLERTGTITYHYSTRGTLNSILERHDTLWRSMLENLP